MPAGMPDKDGLEHIDTTMWTAKAHNTDATLRTIKLTYSELYC